MNADPFHVAARAADLVFRGTVEQVTASTEAAVPPDDTTAVVRVQQVLHAPDVFAGLAGQKVTVRLRQPGSLTVGQEAVFFAEGLLFGDTLVVAEIDHHPVEDSPEALVARVQDARSTQNDSELRERVNRADVIVHGRVADVRAPATGRLATEPTPGRPISEHDPHWMEAVVTVERALKGELAGDEAVVIFPASPDVAWVDAPKLRPGQEGVFLLHRQDRAPQLAALARADAYVAPSVRDVLAVDQVERLENLVSGSD